MKKRIYQLSLVGLGVGAVAVLAYGLSQRAGKAREESADAREPWETREMTPSSAEGEALSSPGVEEGPISVRGEALPRDEAMAEIWGSEQPDAERPELLELSSDLAGELETRGDTYDGIEPEDLGAEWLARATEASPTHLPGPPRGGALSPAEPRADDEIDANEIDEDDLGRA